MAFNQCLCCLSALLFFTLTPAVTVADVISSPLLPVEFHCHGAGNELTWLVNGSALSESEKQNRQITFTNTSIMNDTLSSDLTIIALPINDGIEIGCIVVTKSPFAVTYFNEILLTIRGISFVRNVTLNFTTSSYDLLISWSPPLYYFNDIPDFLNYTYQVIASDEIGNQLLINNNVSSTIVAVPNITECDTFDVTITAFLDQYTSNNSTIRNNGSYGITFGMCLMHQNLIIEFNYLPSSQSCQSLLSIDIETEDKSGIAHRESLIISGDKSDERMNFTLSPFKHYQMAIVIETLQQGVKIYQNHTNFSTFTVQDFYVSSEYTNGSVRVQCLYDLKCDLDIHNEESTVKECLIAFKNNDDDALSYNISGPSETLVTLPTSGNYTVTVYDIIDDLIYGPSVETIQIEVIVKNTSSSDSTVSTAAPTASATPTTSATPTASETSTSIILLIGIMALVLLIILLAITVFLILLFCLRLLHKKRGSLNIEKKKEKSG